MRVAAGGIIGPEQTEKLSGGKGQIKADASKKSGKNKVWMVNGRLSSMRKLCNRSTKFLPYVWTENNVQGG